MKRRLIASVSVFAITVLLLVGCSSNSVPAHEHDVVSLDVQEITIYASEFLFTPDNITLETGKLVRFSLVNSGAIEHELEVTTDDGVIHIHAMPESINTVEFILGSPGTYEMICYIPGHKEAGMTGTLTVSGLSTGAILLPVNGDGHHEEDDHEATEIQSSSVMTAMYVVDSFGFHAMSTAYDEATEVGGRDAGKVAKVLTAVQFTTWPEALEHQVEALVEDLEELHSALEAGDLELSREAFHAIHTSQHDLSGAAYEWMNSQISGEEFETPEGHH